MQKGFQVQGGGQASQSEATANARDILCVGALHNHLQDIVYDTSRNLLSL